MSMKNSLTPAGIEPATLIECRYVEIFRDINNNMEKGSEFTRLKLTIDL